MMSDALTGDLHRLKTWPEFYQAVKSGKKTFEVRKHDRYFKIGDLLCLQEWEPTTGKYTGQKRYVEITYILVGGQFGIEEGYCVMGFR